MSKAPFYAKDQSLNVQTFLYACAFWTVAGDEELKSGEQAWLVEQFGEAGATRSLEEFVKLESDAFFRAFDESAQSLTDGEKRFVYPQLEAWLLSAIQADDEVAPAELDVIRKIKARLSLDDEIQRLTGRPPAPTQLAPRPAAPAPAPTPKPAAPSRKTRAGTATERVLEGHTAEVNAIAVNADGTRVLSGCQDGEVRLWDFAGGTDLRTVQGHDLGVSDLAWCPDGKRFVSGDGLGVLRVWEAASGELTWTHHKKKRGGVTSLALDPRGRLAALSSDIGQVWLIDLERHADVRGLGEKRWGSIHSVCFSPDGKLLACGGDDWKIRIWETGSGALLKTLEGHEDGVMSVAFSPDGGRLASGGRENAVRLWDVAGGKCLRALEGHEFTVYSVCFSPDGRRVASASWDHTVKVWDAASGETLFNLESLDARFSAVVFHPDGRTVLAAGSDKLVHVVKLE